MILPPGTEKSTLAALESLLTTPTPARLPPPPYSHLLAGLERTRTGESSRSGTSGNFGWGGRGAEAEESRDGDSGTGIESGEEGLILSDNRRRRRRSVQHTVGNEGPRGLGTVPGSDLSSETLQDTMVGGATASVPFIAMTQLGHSGFTNEDSGLWSPGRVRMIASGSSEAPLGRIRMLAKRGKDKVWTGLQASLGLWEDPDGSGKRKWRRWTRRRWGLFVMVIFLFLGGVIGGTVGGLLAGEHMHRHSLREATFSEGRVVLPWSADTRDIWIPAKDGTPAYDGVSSSCNSFVALSSTDPIRSISFTPAGMNQSLSTFFLPMNASEVFIHSMGDSASGSIRVLGQELATLLPESVTLAPAGQVRIDVVMNWSGNASSEGMVCHMAKDDGGVGVGVYTPKTSIDPDLIVAPDPNLSFFILVRFPLPSDSPVSMPLLNITTDQMSLRLGNLTDLVDFDRLEVKSGRGAITSGYTAGRDISLVTSTASIAGTYNTSSSLMMNTTAGGILANLIAWNPLLTDDHDVDFQEDSGSSYLRRRFPPSYHAANVYRDLSEVGERSVVDAVIDVDRIPTNPVSVTAQTTSGPLILTYLAQDPGVILSSVASTTNADTRVSLHPSFQGSFLVKSAIGDMRIPEANDFDSNGTSIGGLEADPWSLGRERVVSYDSEEDDGWAVKMLNETGTDIGYTPQRGNAVYDSETLTWSVQGLAVWLTQAEIIAGSANITAEIIALAKQQTNGSALTGVAAMRQSTSVCTTSWGGAELEW